jgi:hypothetical protein
MNEETDENVEQDKNVTVNIVEKSGVGSAPYLVIMTFIMAIGNFAAWWSIPWVWVFSPLWGPFALVGGVLAFCLAIFVCAMLCIGGALLYEFIKEKF